MEIIPLEKKAALSTQVIEEHIQHVYYYRAGSAVNQVCLDTGPSDPKALKALYMVTHCVVVLKNNKVVTAESICNDYANFNEDVGKRLAYEKALNKISDMILKSLNSMVKSQLET